MVKAVILEPHRHRPNNHLYSLNPLCEFMQFDIGLIVRYLSYLAKSLLDEMSAYCSARKEKRVRKRKKRGKFIELSNLMISFSLFFKREFFFARLAVIIMTFKCIFNIFLLSVVRMKKAKFSFRLI